MGCIGKAPVRGPETTLPETHEKTPREQLIGTWELRSKDGTIKQMIFSPDGELTFRGGLEFYNPAQWALDSTRQELTITMLNAPDEKLDIFHMYLGDGVKRFDRRLKEVTFAFDNQTWSLNVAGWVYSKPDKPADAPLAEPVLK
jgi:hypothetical protein